MTEQLNTMLLMVAGEAGIAWAKGVRHAINAKLSKKQVTRF
jgi:hypothetical protein